MNPGTDRRQRFPPALEAGAFPIDGTSLENRLAMMGRLARQLLFFDLQDREAGDWSELFLGDESCVLARILATDLETCLAQFLRDLRKPLNRAQLAAHVIELALEMDLWYKSLAANTALAAVAVRARIRELVSQHLAADMQPIMDVSTAQGLYRGPGPGAGFERMALARTWLDPIWHHATRAVRDGRTVDAHLDVDAIRRCFSAFLGAMSRVQELARELLPGSLVTQTHAPAAGLLLTFAQLLSVVQRKFNQFPDRHIDFYYRDCLRFTPRPGRLESVHLVCTRNARFSERVALRAGTALIAGKDATGTDIEFRADTDLLVTDAKVEKVAMLLLERDPLISPERDFDYVTRVKATPPMAAFFASSQRGSIRLISCKASAVRSTRAGTAGRG